MCLTNIYTNFFAKALSYLQGEEAIHRFLQLRKIILYRNFFLLCKTMLKEANDADDDMLIIDYSHVNIRVKLRCIFLIYNFP